MPSLKFPDTGTRLVILSSGKPAANRVGYLYADAALTVPAEVYFDDAGAKGLPVPLDANGRRAVSLNAYGEQADFWGPAAGTDRLWIVVGGVASVVDADYKAQIDAVEARVTAVESGGAGDALVLHKAGNETKTGVLTFTSSPIVPTPTSSTAAANKGYVDTVVGGLSGATTLNVGKVAGTVAAGDDARLTAPGLLVSEQAGGTDLLKLQTAVTAAATFGTWAIINGNYTVAGSINVPSGARIDGFQGTVTQTASLTTTWLVANASNVVIRGVNATGLGSDYVNNSTVLAAAGIYVSGTSSNVKIRYCNLTNHAGAGVRTGNATTDVRIVGNTITGPGSPTITALTSNYGMGVTAGDGASKWSAIDNTISQYAQGINSGDGVDVRLINNDIFDIVGQHGIYIDATDKLVINSNQIWNTGLQGIKIQIANSTTGQDCSGVTITGNTLTNVGSHGILLAKVVSGSRQFRNVTITSNVISTSGAGGDGINLTAVIGGLVTGNYVSNARHGISTTTCSELSIGPNRFKNLQNNGVLLTDTTDTEVFRNRVVDPATADVVGGEYGIYVAGTSGAITIDGNIVSDAGAHMRYGLFIAATATQSTCVVRNNDFSGATDYGARLDSAQSIKEWSNNVCSGALGDVLNFPSTLTIKGAPPEHTGTAAPTTGAWVRGTIVWNRTPAANGVKGWVCVTAGTPGTWDAFGDRQSVWSGPAGNSEIGANYDPLLANVGVGTTTAGVLLVARIQLPRGGPVTSVDYLLTGAGTGLTAGQNWIAVYDAAFTLIGQSADQTTAFGSTGQKSATLVTPTAVQDPGAFIYVGFLWNGSGSPQLRGVASAASFVNVGLTAANYRHATAGTGLTAPPDPLPVMAASTQPAWFGVR